MRSAFIRSFIAGIAALSLAVPVATVSGADRGRAKQSVHQSNAAKAKNKNRRPARQPQANRPNRPTGGNNRPNANNNRPGNNRPDRNNNRVVAGNTVVVNHGTDRNYHHSGYDYDHHGHWDDDDDDFLEFLGKTAAVTAGVGITAAIIGSIVDDEPDDCQQTSSYGQTYLYCNGVWYQPMMYGSDVQYMVVEDPR